VLDHALALKVPRPPRPLRRRTQPTVRKAVGLLQVLAKGSTPGEVKAAVIGGLRLRWGWRRASRFPRGGSCWAKFESSARTSSGESGGGSGAPESGAEGTSSWYRGVVGA